MNEKENILSDSEVKDLQKQMADREARTAEKVNKLLRKGRDLTASDINWMLGKEVRRKRIAEAMKMSISTFERYLADHGLTTKPRSKPADMDEVKNLVKNTDLSPKEISDQTGVSYSAVYYYYKQKEKEGENVPENLNKSYEEKIKQLEERIQGLKGDLTGYEKAIGTLKADRQKLFEELHEERTKVREREKMIEKLSKDVQELSCERDELLKKFDSGIIQKQHDLLLEYIRLGV